MMREMIDAFDRIDADDDVRAVIVTGAGRGFCAGADLSAGGRHVRQGRQRRADAGRRTARRRRHGLAADLRVHEAGDRGDQRRRRSASGITMTLPMDIRLASTSAKIGFVFARRGIVPEACSSWFLPRFVGISQALEWCYSGRVFSADEALAGGLVSSIHEPDDLLPAARAIAAEIVDNTVAGQRRADAADVVARC